MVQSQRREAEEHKPALSHKPEQADRHTVQHDTATSVTRNRTQSHNLIGWGSHSPGTTKPANTLSKATHRDTRTNLVEERKGVIYKQRIKRRRAKKGRNPHI